MLHVFRKFTGLLNCDPLTDYMYIITIHVIYVHAHVICTVYMYVTVEKCKLMLFDRDHLAGSEKRHVYTSSCEQL